MILDSILVVLGILGIYISWSDLSPMDCYHAGS